VAVLVAIALFVFRDKEEPAPEAVAVVEAKPVKAEPKERDTGEVKDPVPAAPVTPARPKARPSSGSSAPATPRPAPVGAKAALSVSWQGAVVPGQIEVTCPGGFRDRKAVSGGSVTVADVPTGESCSMYAKGGVTSTPASVRGGKSYTCTIVGTTTSCK
jgi:hypothetical protein